MVPCVPLVDLAARFGILTSTLDRASPQGLTFGTTMEAIHAHGPVAWTPLTAA